MEKYGEFLKENSPRKEVDRGDRMDIKDKSNESRQEKLSNNTRRLNNDKMNNSYITDDNKGLPRTNFDYIK